MMFKDLEGTEGIEKLMECVPYVDEIFSDESFIQSLKGQDMSWMDAALFVHKNHAESISAVMNILEEKPKTSVEILSTIASIVLDIFQGDTRAFFISQCKKMRSVIRAMVSTEDGQSKDS